MNKISFNPKNNKTKTVLCLALTFALLSMLFLPLQQSSGTDPIGISYSVNGRRLSAALAGDTSDWIEIAQYKNTDNTYYSLIVRANYLNIYSGNGHYNDPTWQYTAYGSPLTSNYLSSDCSVRNYINKWFNGQATGTAVDNLSANARIRSYTVQNNMPNAIGTSSTTASLTNGFSQPSPTNAATGNDVAFALSYSEAAAFVSLTHDVRGMNPQMQPSNVDAVANFGKMSVPQIYYYGMWLRSPGDISGTAGGLGYTGRVFQLQISPSGNNERGLVYPALWVQSSIFPGADTEYTVHYYLVGTTTSVASDKVVFGQAVGSLVTENAISVSGYTALAPTSVTKTLAASNNEFVFYYTTAPPATTSYTVHYYLVGTTTSVASDKVVFGQAVGSLVTENAISVSGYTALAPTSATKSLAASNNDFTFYYTKNPEPNDNPTVVDGRILPPSATGDSVNWIEIAKYGDYSLIVRTNYLNIYSQAAYYGNPTWQYTAYGAANNYGTSTVRDKINAWFNGISFTAADNLPANARLRNYTVINNALTVPGTSSTTASLTNGFSKPTSNQVGTGNDVAFALSYSEAAAFVSLTHDVRGMNPQMQPSNVDAVANFGKMSVPQIYSYGMWLRSPGDISGTMGDLDYTGRVFQFMMNPNGNNERGLVYPALWVNSSIFETSYTVQYLNATTSTPIAPDKVASGQIGSLVTENAISVSGYTALAPTSITKTLAASNNVFVFYYKPREDLSYVVNYLELGTNNVLASQKVVGNQVFNTAVTEYAIDIAGYTKVEPTSVTFTINVENNVVNFYYTKQNCAIGSIAKTVNDVAFDVWLAGYNGDVALLVSGMSFALYEVNADGTVNYGAIVATGVLNPVSGMIDFTTVSSLSTGKYAIVETLSGKAAEIFEQPANPLYISIGADGKIVNGTNFDYNAKYWSTDAFYRSKGTADLAVTYFLASSSVPLRNPWLNDFQTSTYDPATGSFGSTYSSFCGYYNSGKLGGDTYNGPTLVYIDVTDNFAALKPGTKEDIVSALNYVYDTWGSLDQWPNAYGTSTPSESTKLIAQLAIWVLLNDGVTAAYSDFAYINICVADVLANYQGYSGSKTISDIVFLADEGYPNNLQYCQPQIIPIFSESTLNNQLKSPQGSLSIAKTVNGVAFDVWLAGYNGDVALLVSGMSFALYEVNADGTVNYGTVIANGVLNPVSGTIDFNTAQSLTPGRYAIVETLSGKAAEIFAPADPLYIYVSENGDAIEDFDYNAQYYVSWSWFNNQGRVGLTGVPTGYYYITEIWNIETRTSLGSNYKVYDSFCADGTARTFAETDSYTVGQLDQETYNNILAALNYIYNKYGSIDAWQGNNGPITVEQSTKVLSQMVIWTLIHNDVALQGMRVAETGYNADDFASALQDVLDNSAGSTGEIKDLVYLVGLNFPNDIVSHQPQIIPLFGNPVFNNTVLDSC